MVIGGLPCPARNDGNNVPWVGHGYVIDASAVIRYPIQWIVYEGQNYGDIWCWYTNSAFTNFARNIGVGSGNPFSWTNGDGIYVEIHYETDAP